jgi:hypothetical protein
MQGFGRKPRREQTDRTKRTYVRQDSLNYEIFVFMPHSTVIKNEYNGSIT